MICRGKPPKNAKSWNMVMQNHANHAQDQHYCAQKIMDNDVWYVGVYHQKTAKSYKIMQSGHEKSCKSCTRLAPLWSAKKIMKNDVWYMGVTSQFQAFRL